MSNPFDGPLGGLTALAMARMNAKAEREAAEMAAVRPGERALVVGFGPGLGVAMLASCGAKVVGLDPSAAMMRAATRRNRAAIASGQVRLVRATLEAFAGQSANFDLAIAVHSLQFCRPLDRAAATLGDLLAPGGRLVTITHGWAMARTAGTIERFLQEAQAAFAATGFVDIQAGAAKADKGDAVRFAARRPG
jgi:SAM-dependent methyltransferase